MQHLTLALITDPDARLPRQFVGRDEAEVLDVIGDFYQGQWEEDYPTVRAYVEDMGLELTRHGLPSRANDPNTEEADCPRHAGPWGKDSTCEHCVDDDGNTRERRAPGLLGQHPSSIKAAISNRTALWAAFDDVRSSYRLALAEHLDPRTINAVDTTVADYLTNYYGDD